MQKMDKSHEDEKILHRIMIYDFSIKVRVSYIVVYIT